MLLVLSSIYYNQFFNFLDKGFDFDGEEGHDELVVGSVINKIKKGIEDKVFEQLKSFSS